jgi:hypothetical protein
MLVLKRTEINWLKHLHKNLLIQFKKANRNKITVSKYSFSKLQLVLFIAVFAAVGGYILLSSQAAGSTANVFVSPTGSDAGANCKRYATAQAFPGGVVCATFNKAYQLASCGDTVEVEGGGSYGDQDLTNDATKSACSSNVVIIPATGAGSTQIGIKTDNLDPAGNDHGITIDGADHVTVSGFRNVHGELEFQNCTTGSVLDNDATADGNLYIAGQVNDVTIKNSSWGGTNRYFPKLWPGGCGDGQNHNVTIGPGNVIHDVVSDNLAAAHVDGILIIEYDGLTITGNTFYNNDVGDLAFGNCCTATSTDAPVIIENNFFGPSDASIEFQNNKTHWANFNIRNNSSVVQTYPFDCSTGCSGNKISGNLFALPSTASCAGGGFTYSHNVWVGPVSCGGTGDISVASAGYVNSGAIPPDLHLTLSSLAIDKGDPANCPATDIDGQTRPNGAACDAGADEFYTADAVPPTVSLTAPANGATVSGSSVTLSANASDNVGVAGVQFKLDGANLGAEDTTAPYSTSWNTNLTANGSHSLTAVARDGAGNTTTSPAVTVTVSNAPDTTPPTVSLTAPASGASVIGNVTVSANASDNVGVAGVQFKLDGVNLQSELTNSPYSISWDTSTTTNGSHILTALARDGAGNTTTSTAISVTVNNPNILLGNQAVETKADPISVQQAEAWPFTATGSGNAGSVSINLDASSTAQGILVGLYADSSGSPGSLLATATISSPAAGWNTANFASSPAITSGTSYWLGVLGTGTGQVAVRDRLNGSCSAKINAAPNNWTSLHNPFGATGGSFTDCPISAYVSAASGGASIQGDLNGDGHVTVTDLSIMLSHYGQAATASQGDINGDNTCNILDLSILLSHYGQ